MIRLLRLKGYSSKCLDKQFPKKVIKCFEDYIEQNQQLVEFPLTTRMKTSNYIGYYMRTLSYYPSLITPQRYRRIKSSLKNNLPLTMTSCYLITKYLQKFNFEGDENFIIENLHKYIQQKSKIQHTNELQKTRIAFKQLMQTKAIGPINFRPLQEHNKLPKITKLSFILKTKNIKVNSLIKSLKINDEETAISFQYKKKGQYINLKIVGIQVPKKFKTINNSQYIKSVQKHFIEQISSLKNSIFHTQCVIIKVEPQQNDKQFQIKQTNQSKFMNPKPVYLLSNKVEQYVNVFKKTRGLVYVNEKIDMFRSILLHLSIFNKEVILYPYNEQKYMNMILSDKIKNSLKQMREKFALIRLFYFHEQVQKANILKTCPNKSQKCCYDQNFSKPKEMMNKLEDQEQFGFTKYGQASGNQIKILIQQKQYKSYTIIAQKKDIWDIFTQINASDNSQFAKLAQNHKIQTKQDIQRRIILEVIYGTPISNLIPTLQSKQIKQTYNTLMYPIKLNCT